MRWGPRVQLEAVRHVIDVVLDPLPARVLPDLERRVTVPLPSRDHRPGTRVDVRVGDRRFVMEHILVDHREALDDVDVVAEEIADRVEPLPVALIGHVDDERVALPPAA